MKYVHLTDTERKHAREVRIQELLDLLVELERRHYALELEYRIAAKLENEPRKDAARAAQAALDAQYEVVLPDYEAAKNG